MMDIARKHVKAYAGAAIAASLIFSGILQFVSFLSRRLADGFLRLINAVIETGFRDRMPLRDVYSEGPPGGFRPHSLPQEVSRSRWGFSSASGQLQESARANFLIAPNDVLRSKIKSPRRSEGLDFECGKSLTSSLLPLWRLRLCQRRFWRTCDGSARRGQRYP